MKQRILIIWLMTLSIGLSAQNWNYYFVKDNGKSLPGISVHESSNNIQLTIDIESFSSKTIEYYSQYGESIHLLDGVNVMEKGLPDIQHLVTSIILPPLGATRLVIDSVSYIDYNGFNILPSGGDPGLYNDSDRTPDESIYKNDAFWPSELASAEDPYIAGNIRAQSVHFFPVQYNPVTQTLRVYHHIAIRLELLNEPGINELTTLNQESTIEKITRKNYINYKENQNSLRYNMVNESEGSMLIISHPDFMETMQSFLEWKIQKGIHCEMVDVTTIGNAEAIKLYVNDYYNQRGLTYLLLVGDEKYVPSNQAEKGVSDIMYGYISGDDHYPEILVGRFPCEKAEQCRVMVERTLNYEKNPSTQADFNNFLGIGSGLGPGDDGELDYEHVRNIAQLLHTSTYSDVYEMYDGSRGGNDQNGNPNIAMVSNAINEGQGAVMYIGHGSSNSWLTSGFSTTDAKNLENTETHPFIWAAGCNNGTFAGTTCLAEGLLRAEKNGKPTGAIATLMSSATQTWYPPMEAQDEIGKLLSNFTNGASVSFGGLSYNGCMKMNDKYGKGAYIITDNWILFGDPSVELRTDTPQKFIPKHMNVLGTDAVQLKVTNLPDGAYLALTYGSTILSTSFSNSGAATLEFPEIPLNINELTLTITGHNYLPYISILNVTNLPGEVVNPNPSDYSYQVLTRTGFNWELTGGCNPVSYIFSFRKTGSDNWTQQIVNDPGQININKLEYSTAYEWKVSSLNNSGETESKIFSFTTIKQPDEDFEEEGFARGNWLNTQSWYIDNLEAYEGNFSLHSGSTFESGTSSLYYECETVACDYISFWLKLNITDSLSRIGLYVDDFPVAEWNYTMPWTKVIYQIEPGMHKFEWRFEGSADSTSLHSAAWLDNIYLPVNQPVEVTSDTLKVCDGSPVAIEVSVKNYASLQWSTSGTGHFDDPWKKDALYFPSDDDMRNDQLMLTLNIIPNATCEVEIYDFILEVKRLPEPESPGDSTDIPIVENKLHVYPNPSADMINITGQDGTDLSQIYIYSADGQLISQYDFNGYTSASIPVNQLDPGMYIIRSEGTEMISTSRFIKI